MRATSITFGYPTFNNPTRAIVRHRAVKMLANYANVEVVHLRMWKPKLPFIEKRVWDDVPVLTVSIPQFPFNFARRLNTEFITRFAEKIVHPFLQHTDIIHSNGIFPTGKIAGRWAMASNKPHVTQVIGSDLNLFLKDKNYSGIDRTWLLELDGVACNSKKLSLELINIMPGIQDVRVIYRGVNTHIFSPEGEALGPQSMLIPVRFFYLGGFQTWKPNRFEVDNYKGGHILLKAWKKVEMKIGDSNLLLGGPGINPDKLKPWLTSLHRPDAVHILPIVLPEKVPGLLRGSDVTIIPSLNEGLPNLANESQACGRPVLCSDAGGIPETVLHESTGRIVPKGDANQLAGGIIWFYKHQDQLPEMGRQARKHMIANFNWETSVQKMMSLFYSAIAHHSQHYIE